LFHVIRSAAFEGGNYKLISKGMLNRTDLLSLNFRQQPGR